MKRFTFFLSGLILGCCLFAQAVPFKRTIKPVDDRPVRRSERPRFDYSMVPADKIQPGIIRVRFTDNMSPCLDTLIFHAGQDGILLSGIPALDSLNSKYKVSRISQTFFVTMQARQFDKRHRNWGLNLWYDLFVPGNTDTRQMAAEYAGLPLVNHSEPGFIMKIIDTVYRYAIPLMNSPLIPANTYPNDPQFSHEWHLNNTGQFGGTPGCDIHAPAAWDLCTGDTEVIVAVMDEGIDYHHADLSANMWQGMGYNFIDHNNIIIPGLHGTHVAGIIGAVTNNGTGISGIAGGNGSGNGVRLMSCMVGENGGISGVVVDSYAWAADHGAAISNNSWGSAGNVLGFALLDAIDYFVVNGGGNVMEGGIVICAAGNLVYPEFLPAAFDNCLAVAATNNKDKKTAYSNAQHWVDISAPGGETPPDSADILSTLPGNQYGLLNGTSIACPQVAGVAGLVVSYAKGRLSAPDLLDILVNSTDNIDALNPSYTGKLGSGRVNAFKALQLAQSYIHSDSIEPPADLTALAVSDTQVNLGWQPDADDDSVLLAYNLIPAFGHPGGYYLPGEAIDNGGIVLYTGKATTFSHTQLDPNVVYYYSLWSLKNNSYSYRFRRSQDTTFCGASQFLPYSQGFSTGPFRPFCWSESNPASPWQFVFGDNDTHPPAAHSGVWNALYLPGSGTGQVDKLITGAFDLSSYSMVQLSFWHTQEKRGNNQDELRIYYRTGPSAAWILIQTYNQSIQPWTKDSIQLPSLSSWYQLAFEATNHFGYGVCLDDIEISDIAPPYLTVTPSNRNVLHLEGNTTFLVNTNKYWTAASDAGWCRNDYTGKGSDTLHVHFMSNPLSTSRTAHISVAVEGLAPVTVTVTQEGTTGAGTINNENGLTLWPNPLKDETRLFIKGNDLRDPEISLEGIDGRTVLRKKILGLNEFNLDIRSVSPGCYFLVIRSGGRVYAKPMIKIH